MTLTWQQSIVLTTPVLIEVSGPFILRILVSACGKNEICWIRMSKRDECVLACKPSALRTRLEQRNRELRESTRKWAGAERDRKSI